MSRNENAARLTEGAKNETDKRLQLMYTITLGVIIVMFIFVVGGMFSYLQQRAEEAANKQAAYQSLRDQVKEQNDKIEALTEALSRQKAIQETD